MNSICLNGTWDLTWGDGAPLITPEQYMGERLFNGRAMIKAQVPSPIHKVLMDNGIIGDPNFGMNVYASRWVEEAFWVYRHKFQVPETALNGDSWLVFEKCELNCFYYLNGELLGTSSNSHTPTRLKTTGKIRTGDNNLCVKLDTGLIANADKPGIKYETRTLDTWLKRFWNRTPQSQYGWDQAPRLLNVGIMGDVYLEWTDAFAIGQTAVYAMLDEDLTSAEIVVKPVIRTASTIRENVIATLSLSVEGCDTKASCRVELVPGSEAVMPISLSLENPKLWWPRGYGEQNLYNLTISLRALGICEEKTIKTGIRRVSVDQSPHPVEGRYFTLEINNTKVFCKGSNWVPPDLLYTETSIERYESLINSAVEVNMNFMRIWGGGPYPTHDLLEMCDRAGIIVWQDLAFACAKYPGDDPVFATEIRREAAQIMRELSPHPCIAVWCGNNEIELADWCWGYDDYANTHPHYALFHHDLPRVAMNENPSVFYWISSPYSPDYAHPNDPTRGDQHPWKVGLEMAAADWWEFRTYVDRFPDEGGIFGASTPKTLRQYMPGKEWFVHSNSWDLHDNSFALGSPIPGDPGRAYQTVTLWTGKDTNEMTLDDYCFISGILHAEGLTEYITNYRRRMYDSSAAVFWVFNDTWPNTNHWSIVDYSLRKKLAYHPVRRAYQPITTVVFENGAKIGVKGVNDSRDIWHGTVRYGVFRLSGGKVCQVEAEVTLYPGESVLMGEFDRDLIECEGFDSAGAFAVLEADSKIIAQHRIFFRRFHELNFGMPDIKMDLEKGILTLVSDSFAWAVCLDVDGELPLKDNCFDLLPGEPYTMEWPDKLGEPEILRVGNEIFHHDGTQV